MALLLADGRWPGGGHAHSGGLEAAVEDGSVHDEATLRAFLLGRLHTSGPTDAWFAGASCAIDPADPHAASALLALEDRYEARMPSGAQRKAGRTLGRGLRRVARQVWEGGAQFDVEQYVVVLGAVARLAGLSPHAAARIAVHNLVAGAATAAPKLYAIDMVDAMRAAVSLAPVVDELIVRHVGLASPPAPRSAPLSEIRAERHALWDVRLFAS